MTPIKIVARLLKYIADCFLHSMCLNCNSDTRLLPYALVTNDSCENYTTIFVFWSHSILLPFNTVLHDGQFAALRNKY